MADYMNGTRSERLRKAWDSSYEALRPFRSDRLSFIEAMLGAHYGGRIADKAILNLVELAVTSYMSHLVGGPPRAQVNALKPSLWQTATLMRLGLDRLIKNIRLHETISLAARDAMFGPGVLMVGMKPPGARGFYGAVNQLFVESVSLDDWCHDMSAMAFDQCQFMGNIYLADLDDILENEQYDGEAKDQVRKITDMRQNEGGGKRVSALATNRDIETFRDLVALRQIWLPQDGLLVTMTDEGGAVLAEQEMDGPEHGPYRILSYNPGFDSAMPLPPLATWKDLHDATNAMLRKSTRQALRQKDFLAGKTGATKDAKTAREGEDGAILLFDNPRDISPMSVGGANSKTLMMGMQFKDWFNEFAGNLGALAGLGVQADTASQESQLLQQANARLAAMNDRLYAFTDGVLQDLASYMWNDPFIHIPLTRRLPVIDAEISTHWSADQRAGTLLDYEFQIAPYSMQRKGPQAKLNDLMTIVQSIVMPLAQQVQMQGGQIDVQRLINKAAELSGLEAEMAQVVQWGMPQDPRLQQGQPMGDPPAKAPNTTRRYIRENRGGARMQGKQQVRMAQLLGQDQGAQPDEAAMAMR